MAIWIKKANTLEVNKMYNVPSVLEKNTMVETDDHDWEPQGQKW